MKTENRKYHHWINEDEYGIYTCQHCGKLMRKEARSTVTLRNAIKSTGKWIFYYSEKGTKWTIEHIDCI